MYLLYIDWLLLDDIHYSKTHSLCIIEPLSVSSILLTVFQLLHTLIVVYCLHLFVAPLREMTKHSDCINQESVNSSLLALTTKYTILHCSTAISSVILMILLLSTGAGHYYAMFHSFINATVMILLHPLQNDLFRKLCCLPLYLCALTHRHASAVVDNLSVVSLLAHTLLHLEHDTPPPILTLPNLPLSIFLKTR